MSLSKNSIKTLLVNGVLIHIALLIFCADLYFKSPVFHGMTPYNLEAEPFAKRLVLFIADGLRAETIYKEEYKSKMPFLTSIRESNSSWGVVHTSVPTETRPGHASILGGVYEDPSAIFTGWQANTKEFDTVINESNYAWVYGSPDIVYMFPKKDAEKLNVDAYDAEFEDFSGKSSTILLDNWVFNKIDTVLKPKPGSCNESDILNRFSLRKIEYAKEELLKSKTNCLVELENCKIKYVNRLNSCSAEFKKCSDDNSLNFDKTVSKIKWHVGSLCEKTFDNLHENGNLFVLHLLGMDTVGHVHKPNSVEYIMNLEALDIGIKKTAEKFIDFYGDDGTVFVFTSDHGMTNWGSHGDGSDHETEVPYIMWGSGIQTINRRIDIQQSDLTPLMAVLIGIPIPTNSLGILPSVLLKGTKIQILKAEFNNFKQLAEQYFVLKNDIKKDYFYKDNYKRHNDDDFKAVIESIKININNVYLIETNSVLIKNTLTKIMDAIDYIKSYYFIPKIICVVTGFIMWMIYLAFSMYADQKFNNKIELDDFEGVKSFVLMITNFLLAVLYIYFVLIYSSLITYLYPLFPFIVFRKLVNSKSFLETLYIIRSTSNKKQLFIEVLKYLCLIQLLVLCFFNKAFIVVTLFLLILWSLNDIAISFFYTVGMRICLLVMSIYVLKGWECYELAEGLGWISWSVYYYSVVGGDAYQYFKKFPQSKVVTRRIIILAVPIILFLLACGNLMIVNSTFKSESGVFYINKLLSWLLSGISLCVIPMTSTRILFRFHQICACLLIPYTLTSVNADVLFYTIFTACLYFWMQLEACVHNNSAEKIVNIKLINFSKRYPHSDGIPSSSQYKRTYTYLALTTSYFLLTNAASFNSFDPMWTKAYVSVFNLNLMGAIIMWKIITPFFTVTTAFYAINILTRTSPKNVFTILMLFLDQMVLNFMFFIKNKGSWKEIGMSISHFVIMEFMAVIVLIFYIIVEYVTTYKLFKFLYEDSLVFNKEFEADPNSRNELRSKILKQSRRNSLPEVSCINENDTKNRSRREARLKRTSESEKTTLK